MLAKSEYALGHSDRELERLQLQADCLEALTRRLIRESGLKPGMRVVDIGCGAGDVAMLIAEFVGVTGEVVAIDMAERAVETASRRAQAKGFKRIKFVIGTDESLTQFAPFHAAIGRCVLVHQRDPVAVVRRVAAAVEPGGPVAFLEPAIHVAMAIMPEIEILRAVGDSVMRCMRLALPHHDIAGRIISCFVDAGLPEPRVLWESVVPGSDRTYIRWLVSTYETFLPLLEQYGAVDPAVGDLSTLYDRIDAGMTARRVQGATPPYVSAWAARN
jgi:ubiquinone/menaquinone biosynthesis C-methylase UbiE